MAEWNLQRTGQRLRGIRSAAPLLPRITDDGSLITDRYPLAPRPCLLITAYWSVITDYWPPATGHFRTYSPSKVIHRWRGELLCAPPRPTVNNFGGGAKMFGEHLTIWLSRKAEHAGPGRRIPHSNVSTFTWRLSLRDPAPCRKGILRTLRLQVQTCQRRTSISASIRQGRRAQRINNHNSNYEYNN